MSEIQLNKLENKIITSDEILADREETLEALKQDTKDFELQLKELNGEKEAAYQEIRAINSKLASTEELAVKYKHNLDKLMENMEELQNQAARMEMIKHGGTAKMKTPSPRVRKYL